MARGDRARRPGRLELGALALILLAAALLRGLHPGADLPWEVERTNAPFLDAYWYLEAGAGPADGSLPGPAERARAYEVPVWTSLVRVWLTLLGPSHAAAALLAATLGVVSVALLWRILRVGLGAGPALAGAAALALLYPSAALDRTPLIYGPTTLVLLLAAALWLRGGATTGWRRAAHELAGWALVAAAVVAVRPPAAALAGGLLLASAGRLRGRARALAGACAALAVAAGLGLASFPPLREALLEALRAHPGLGARTADRLQRYLAGSPDLGDLTVRLLAWGAEPGGPLEGREGLRRWGSGFAALAPVTLAVAGLGAAAALSQLRRLPPAARDTTLLFVGWGATFLLGAALVSYRPLRYFSLLGPPVAACAALAVAWAAGRWRPAEATTDRPLTRFVRAPATLAAALAGGAFAWTHAVAALTATPTVERLLAAGLEGALLGAFLRLGWCALPAWQPSPPRAASLAWALALAACAPSGWVATTRLHASPSWRARDAGRALWAAVAAEARVVGPYASLLCLGSGRPRWQGWWIDTRPGALAHTLERLRALGLTHLALDPEQEQAAGLTRRFAEAGAAPTLVAVLPLGHASAGPKSPPLVLVYRLAWAEQAGYSLSPFEQRRAGDRHGAALSPEADPLLREARVLALRWEGAPERAAALTALGPP